MCCCSRGHKESDTTERLNWMVVLFLFFKVNVLVTQSCPTLCDPMDYSSWGSDHGILQARILEWIAIPFSKGASRRRDWTQVSGIAHRFLLSEPQGKPLIFKGSSILFFIVSVPVYRPINSAQGFLLLHILISIFAISYLFNDPDRYEVISLHGFDLHFPNN